VPRPDPLGRLSDHPAFQPFEALVDDLPNLLLSGQLRPVIDALDATVDHRVAVVAALEEEGACQEGVRRRALLLFGGLANAYVWGGGPDVTPRGRIPACTCMPYAESFFDYWGGG
jgi:hypothetical protein